MPTIYSASEIIGKDLYAKKTVKVHTLPFSFANIAYTVNYGGRVGTVKSYNNKDGFLWWQLYENGGNAWVKHEENTFDVKALQSQGAMTEEEKKLAKEKENQSNFDKFLAAAGKGLKTAGIAIGLFFIGKEFFKNNK